jgi:two-component system, chemotaxis family, chemotaxis protein CheY
MKKTILVVDDSEFTRNYHSDILESAGFQVIRAVDGSDGLEKLYCHSCHLVLTDINMSRMDGYELIRRIRLEPRYLDLPIVIISTESQVLDKRKGFEAGASIYLVKPCSPAEMVENLRMLLP